MAVDPRKNFSYGRISVAPTPSDSGTTLSVSNADAVQFLDPAVDGAYNVTIWPANQIPLSSNAEIARVTAKGVANTGGTGHTQLTITRVQESSSSRSIQVGDQIAQTITKKTLDDINTDVSTIADSRITLQKGAANGLATLGSDSKIPNSQLPALAISETYVVASQAAMLALTAQRGDVAKRTDNQDVYILNTDDPTQLANWVLLSSDFQAAVDSVNGRTGVVTGLAEDSAVIHKTGGETITTAIGANAATLTLVQNDTTNDPRALTVTNNADGIAATFTSPSRTLHIANQGLNTGVGTDDFQIYGSHADAVGIVTIAQRSASGSGRVLLVQNLGSGTSLDVTGSAGASQLRVNGDGKVGLNNNNPTRLLTLQGLDSSNDMIQLRNNSGTDKWHLALTGGTDIELVESNVAGNRLRILPGGNMGIGKSPSYTLDVNGTTNTTGFRMPTSPTNGYYLQTNGSGVGSWAALPNATTSIPGIVQLSGDLGGTFGAPTVKNQYRVFNVVKDYGAKANGKIYTDGAMTSGSDVLTSASAPFSASDVGLPISVKNAGPTSGSWNYLAATILAYISPTQVQLSTTAINTVSGKLIMWGNDDKDAIQAALNAADAAGGGIVFFPTGTYFSRTWLQVKSNTYIISESMYGARLAIREDQFNGSGWGFSYFFQSHSTSQNVLIDGFYFWGGYGSYGYVQSSVGGGIAPGKRWTIQNNMFDDTPYFSIGTGSQTIDSKITRNKWIHAGGGDRIGNGGADGLEISYNSWETTGCNSFDNTGGNRYWMHHNINRGVGSFYFEAITNIDCHDNYFTELANGGISVISDGGYGPPSITNSRYVNIHDNHLASGGSIGYKVDGDAVKSTTVGGNVSIYGNQIENASLCGILIDGYTDPQLWGGGYIVANNQIYNCNVDDVGSFNTGYGIVHPSGINVTKGWGITIVGNLLIDDRAVSRMRYGIELGQTFGPDATNQPNNVNVAGNTTMGALLGKINVVSPTHTNIISIQGQDRVAINDPAGTNAFSTMGGGLNIKKVATPSAPTATPQGTTGSTSYSYYAVAEDAFGNKTVPSSVGTTTTGNATLNGTNFNRIVVTPAAGAVKYYVLKTDTATLLGTITTQTRNGGKWQLDDIGQSTSAFTTPTRNPSADSLIEGYLSVNGAGLSTFPLSVKSAASSEDVLRFVNSSGTQRWHIGIQGGNDLNFVESSVAGNRLYLRQGGRVGINNGSPAHALDITVANSSNYRGLNVTQNDTTNNPHGAAITNAGTGDGLNITQSGNGTALRVSNSGTNYSMYLSAPGSRSVYLGNQGGNTGVDTTDYQFTSSHADAVGILTIAQRSTSGTGRALLIQNLGSGESFKVATGSTGSNNALIIDGSGNATFGNLVTLSADPASALQAATKQYVDSAAASGTPDATSGVKGKVQLTNDFGGTAAAPTVVATHLTAALPIAQGGTGQTTASAAFNALSPMTTAGDILYGGASGAGTRLAAGTATQLLHGGTTPSWAAVSLTADVSGTLPAANGGTGQASYAVGDILYASASTTLSKLAGVATGNALISGGVTTAPSWGKIALTTHVSGTLPIANGGTGSATQNFVDLTTGQTVDGVKRFVKHVGVNVAPLASLHVQGDAQLALSGTADVTNGSAAVVGTGTSWGGSILVGDAIRFGSDTAIYQVLSIADTTHLTLTTNYAGTTATGLTAYIDDTLFRVDNGFGSQRIFMTRSGFMSLGGAAAGTFPLSIQATGTANDIFRLLNTSGTQKWHVGLTSGTDFDITESSVANGRLHLSPGGKVGINTTGPGHALDIVVANSSNYRGLNINQNDTTNNPIAARIANAGTGDGLQLSQSGNGTALRVSNAGTGYSMYLDAPGSRSVYMGNQGGNTGVDTADSQFIGSHADAIGILTAAQRNASGSGKALFVQQLGTGTGLDISVSNALSAGTGTALNITHNGATGTSVVVGRTGNSASTVTGTTLSTTNSGGGAAYALSITAGLISLSAAVDVILDTATGTKWGTSSTQKQAWYGATPIVQPSAYTQTYSTADKTHANFTSADLTAFTGGVIGFVDAAERDNVRTQFNALRADVADLKQLVNSVIDDLQALGLAG